MLKLEPREAGRIVFPAAELAQLHTAAVDDAISTLQRWRHYAD
jgi:hypothetical protein